jgi:phenylpropionate dioxygenase-like ring-hydroxylating dioxygenase large terminal subunit
VRVTEEPLLRKFWYCVMPMANLQEKPVGIRLLDVAVVIWKDEAGRPCAARDRCLHRTAKLSLGYVERGNIVCPYHGWEYNKIGQCVKVPQNLIEMVHPFAIESYHCAERYGYIWIALEDPIYGIPEIPEIGVPGYRQIHEFCGDWRCAPLRIMENAFDNAHFAFVHRNSFGDPNPIPPPFTLEDTDDGFIMRTEVPVRNPGGMREALGIADEWTVRRTVNRYFLPFFRVGKITYPNGLESILCTAATPIAESLTRFVQWVIRNDTEEQVPTEQVIAFDKRVSEEDREILESTDANVPLGKQEGRELHMHGDKPGMLMRKKIRQLIHPNLAVATV